MDRFCRGLLLLAGLVGGGRWRRDRLPEWEGELWALRARGAGGFARARFAAVAVTHAAWLRWEEGKGMGGWAQDLGQVARRLARTPGFTAVTVVMLGLGIGVNTALFSALDAALRGSAPYPEPDRLVLLDLTLRAEDGGPSDTLSWSWAKLASVRTEARSFDRISGYYARDLTLTSPGDAGRVGVEVVTPGYFELLGIQPALGRTFGASEEPPAPGFAVVLGHALWTTRFGRDPEVVGRSITVEGRVLEVVGVVPPGFRGLTGSGDLWVPVASASTLLNPALLDAPTLHWLRAIGRLRPDATVAQARAELGPVADGLERAFGGLGGRPMDGIAAVPFPSARVNPVTRLVLLAVLAGGLLLLAIACANVASLLLARATARRSDLAVRAALGAGRGRLVREQLLEGLVLSSCGGLLGVGLAFLAESAVARGAAWALETSGSRSLQYLDPSVLGVNGAALLVAFALAVGTGLVSGLLPLRVATRADLVGALGAGRRGVGSRSAGSGEAARAVLVATQIALTLVLLAGTGLMAASLARLTDVDRGYSEPDVLAMRFERRAPYTDDERRAFEAALLARLSGVPGVRRAAIGPCPPLQGRCEVVEVEGIDGTPYAGGVGPDRMVSNAVSDDYFETLGVPLLEGRAFDAGLDAADAPVALVNATAARTLFGGSALGRRISVTHAATEDLPAEVIGVVADVRYGALDDEPMPAIYFSRHQTVAWYGTLFLRAEGDPYALADGVRREARAVDVDLPLFDVTTLGELEAAATGRTRVVLGLLVAFAALGLLLSAVGVYGVVSYAVVQRTREMGLRLALGAPAPGLVRGVVGRPASLAAAGASVGLVGALVLTRQLRVLLYGVEPGDPLVMGSATVLLVGIAVVAAWIPARRALRVDPAETLRGE